VKGKLGFLLKFLSDSGESETVAQQTVNRKMERVRVPTRVEQKSWQALTVALAFSCLESFRDLSPLNRVILTRDWAGAAKRNGLVPLHGQGTTVRNMYSFV
jgi:hypothetical protein